MLKGKLTVPGYFEKYKPAANRALVFMYTPSKSKVIQTKKGIIDPGTMKVGREGQLYHVLEEIPIIIKMGPSGIFQFTEDEKFPDDQVDKTKTLVFAGNIADPIAVITYQKDDGTGREFPIPKYDYPPAHQLRLKGITIIDDFSLLGVLRSSIEVIYDNDAVDITFVESR